MNKTAFAPARSSRRSPADLFARLPYWLLAAILIGVLMLWEILTNAGYRIIFDAVVKGVWVTIYVCVVAYVFAVLFGLVLGLMRLASNRVINEVSTFYVEIVRGVPMLVILYYVAFVGAPAIVALIQWMGLQLSGWGLTAIGAPLAEFSIRRLDFTARAIIALVLGYSAFIAEIFRAGIESIDRGQMEAARSLGMSYWQAMRFVILPQAVRRVLPPLGNDFIAMLKDSALVSVLGVPDITQMGKVYAAGTFQFFETYNVVAFLYLVMTLALSLFVRYLEERMPSGNTR
jgi:polar amino acid transport system permease protein